MRTDQKGTHRPKRPTKGSAQTGPTIKKPMPRYYIFKSAALTDASGRTSRLDRVDAEFSGTSRRPLRLTMSVKNKGTKTAEDPVVIEMSQREAFAFSEWLDAVATDPKA